MAPYIPALKGGILRRLLIKSYVRTQADILPGGSAAVGHHGHYTILRLLE